MKGKKIKAILLIAVFVLSTLAMAINVSAANLTIVLSESSGNVGDIIEISGTANASVPIDIFWDYTKIDETSADGAGAYSKNITIPEDIVGEHFIAVKDTFHNYIVEETFTIKPKITVTPESGLPEDTFIVSGTGFAAESDMNIFFNSTAYILTTEGDGTAEWTTEEAHSGSDSAELYVLVDADMAAVSIDVDIALEDITDLSFWKYVTSYTSGFDPGFWLFVDADGDGDIDFTVEEMMALAVGLDDPAMYSGHGSDGIIWIQGLSALGAVDTDWVEWDALTMFCWETDTTGGNGAGDVPTMLSTGAGNVEPTDIVMKVVVLIGGSSMYADETAYVDDITLNGVTYDFEHEEDETDVLGSFDVTLTVPSGDYAVYNVSAIDASGNFNMTTFEVTATIDLTPDEGASGTVVDISGIGFNGTKVSIYFGPAETLVKEDIDLTDEGTFTSSFIVPTVDVDVYVINATDDNTTPISAYMDFNVTETTQITLDPTAIEPDSLVTIEGTGFTATAGVEVDIDVGPLMDYLTFTTNSTGGFEETFLVPAFSPGSYDINATDENGLTANASLTVAVTEFTLDPEEGPTGATITVTGSGFTVTSAFNVTFNDEVVASGTTNGAGVLSDTFTVPTVPVGNYTVRLVDELEISGTATFEVNETTSITITPSEAPAEYVVTIEGEYFSHGSDVILAIANSTWSDILEPTATVTTDADGSLECTFEVPDIALGDYLINATDATVLFAEASFSVTETIYIDIETYLTEYEAGETVAFYVRSIHPFNLSIDVKDPSEYPFTSIIVLDADWVEMDDLWVVAYADAKFDLPSEPVTGTWNWTAYDTDLPEMVANGTFTVGVPVGPQPDIPAETTDQESKDSTGATKTSFVLGETVLASSTVTNIGTQTQPMLIIVQWKDPDLRALAPVFILVELDPGDDFTYAPGLILPTTGYTTGTWTASILVLDTWPAQGGVAIGVPVTITITVS